MSVPGFNAFGIASGGGAGWVLAEWAAKGEAPMDLWVVDIRRFSDLHKDRHWTCDRTLEAYGKHYTIGFPHEEYQSGRPRIVSPLYDRLKKLNACFGSKLGWERPNWFAPEGVEPRDIYSMGRQNWFDAVGDGAPGGARGGGAVRPVLLREVRAEGARCRRGPVHDLRQSRCARRRAGSPIRRCSTRRGGIECDLTVAQLSDDLFYIVTGTGFRTHDIAWIADHIKPGLDARLTDVTEAWGTLSLMGPKARDILAKVTTSDVGNAAFPFGAVREIEIAGCRLRALRVTYVGELGWELHVPIAAIGRSLRCADGGRRTAGPEAGRLSRARGAAAGEGLSRLGFRHHAQRLALPCGARLGGEAQVQPGLHWPRPPSRRIAAAPLTKMLAGFTTERDDIVLVGRETILRDGEFAGYLTSGGYGYTIGKPIGYGYVRNGAGVTEDYVRSGRYELVVAKETVRAEVHLAPLYDPGNARVKS